MPHILLGWILNTFMAEYNYDLQYTCLKSMSQPAEKFHYVKFQIASITENIIFMKRVIRSLNNMSLFTQTTWGPFTLTFK